MKRKRNDAKNDFLYGVMMFAMFAVMIFNVAVEYFDRYAANVALVTAARLVRAAAA